MRVLIDGELVADAEATISVFDWGVVRGFGCFEVIRSYGGKPFRSGAHIDRMAVSAAALGIDLPPRQDLMSWVAAQAEAGGDCLVRAYTTAGSRDSLYSSRSRTVVMWEELPHVPDELRLAVRPAPWHPAGSASELSGAKTLSYAPNMAATQAAEEAGFHEALLVSRENWVLEGPTFSVGWFRDGVLGLPALDLLVLASITRQATVEVAAELGLDVEESRATVDEVIAADEVFAMSTVKEIVSVVAIGESELSPGPLTGNIAGGYSRLVAEELSGS